MKKIMAMALSILVISSQIIMPISVRAASVENSVINVSESSVIKPSDKGLLGMHHTYFPGKLGLDGSSMGDEEAFDMMSSYGFKTDLIRIFPTEWKQRRGDKNERGFDDYALEYDFGIAEYLSKMLKQNSDTQFVMTLDINEDPENDADLVRYLTLNPDDENAIGNDGTNWAQMRVDDGIAMPIKVRVFEIGNEVDMAINDITSESETQEAANAYIEKANKVIDAIKGANQNAPVSIHSHTQPHQANAKWEIWNSSVIGALGAKSDYVVIHKYYSQNNNLFTELDNKVFDTHVTAYIDELPEGSRPKLFVSEHSIWLDTTHTAADDRFLATGLAGMLTTAEAVNRMINRSDVEMACYHCLFGGLSTADAYQNHCWGVFRPFDDDTVIMSAVGEYYTMAYDAFGENVVVSSMSGNTYCSDSLYINKLPIKVSAQTTSNGGLNIILVNRNDSVTHNVTLNAEKTYALKKASVLSGTSIYDENTQAEPEKIIAKSESGDISTEFSGYIVPPMSVVTLELVPVASDAQAPVEIKINGTPVMGSSAKVLASDGAFDVDLDIYSNGSMSGSDTISLIIAKNDGNQISLGNAIYLDSLSPIRNRAHFRVQLPMDLPDQDLLMAIGNNGGQNAQIIINLENATGVLGVEAKDCESDDYLAGANVYFKNDFEGSVPIKVFNAISKDIVYLGNVEKTSSVEEISFSMPNDAICGEYIISVGGISGSFVFTKPDELIRLMSIPTASDGSPFTFTSAGDEAINIKIMNVTDKPIRTMILATFYDKSGRVLSVGTVNYPELSPNVITDTPITVSSSINHEDIGAIMLFAWNDSTLTPLTNKYIIKK